MPTACRTQLACVMLAALATAAAGAPAPDGSLLTHPGFEDARSLEGTPQGGWYRNYGDSNSKWEVETAGVHGGAACARLEAPTIPGHNPSVSLEQAVPVTPGKAYLLRAWVKGRPAGTEGLLAIVWLGADRGWISHDGASFHFPSDWDARRVVATAPAGAAYAVARLDIRQVGTAWMDDAFLGERSVGKLRANVEGGAITAGGRFLLQVDVLDDEGFPMPGTEVSFTLQGSGSARLLPADPVPAAAGTAGRPTGVRGYRRVAGEQGKAAVWVQASSRPGQSGTVVAHAGSASLPIRIDAARHGEPSAYRVVPERAAAGPGESLPVRVRLVGKFGEPVALAGRKVSVRVAGEGGATPSEAVTDRTGTATFCLRVPARLYAQARVEVRDAQGLSGSATPVVAAPPLRPDPIRLTPSGTFAHADGRPFLPLGGLYANWVHQVQGGKCGDAVSLSFSDASDEQLRQWFSYLRDNGVTALRAMLRDHVKRGTEPMDLVGKVNENLLGRWEHLMAVARPYGIRFLVTLHESWYATYAAYFNRQCLEACVLPYYSEGELQTLPAHRRRFLVEKRMLEGLAEPMTDPDVLACQEEYLRDLIPRLRGNPDVFAYEVENEQPNGYFDWTEAQIRLVRALDPATPICISHLGGGPTSADPVPWGRKTSIDFYTYHIYPGGAITSQERDYGTAVAVTARYSRLGKPAFSGEAHGDEWFKATPEARRLGARDCIWSELMGGNAGCFFWSTIDEPIREFRLAREIAERVDLTRQRWARPALGIDVGHPLADDRFFQAPAGKELYAAMGRIARECFRRGVAFDFTLDGKGYAKVIKASETEKVAGIAAGVRPPKGYEAQYLFAQEGTAFLCYLRNVAGTVPIQADPGMGWTRSRAPVPATVAIDLPLRPWGLTVYDLDEGRSWRVAFERDRPLNLGTTDHDLVLIAAP